MGLFWLLSQHRQKRSTTPKVLNRVCGSVNQGDLGVSQKRPFLERLHSPNLGSFAEEIVFRDDWSFRLKNMGWGDCFASGTITPTHGRRNRGLQINRCT
jgi:hypothetical protein